jgi:glycosyltransferase involved in cell wall biosynthesis
MARWSWGASSVRQKLKRWWFGLLGKDPEGVVVVFDTGERSRAMFDEVRRLVPDRRVFFVTDDYSGLRGYRVAQCAVLFDGSPNWRRRWAAWRRGPVLAFHTNLEFHQLSWRAPLASLLFVLGVPLDRIFLRPWWWFGGEATIRPSAVEVRQGAALRGLKRAGILTPYLPYPLAHGGAVRIFNLLREAAKHFDITLFAFVEEEAVDLGPLTELCAKVVLVRKPRYREPRWSTLMPPEVGEYESSAMRRALREHPVDLLQVEYTQLARYPGQVLVEHDVTFDLQRQVEAQSPGLNHWWNRWRWERFEFAAARRFPAVVVMSEKDQSLLGKGTVVPNGVDLERYQPRPETAGRRLLFIGSFRHFPNVTGLRWFLDEVWGRLPADVELDVVAGPSSQLYWEMPAMDRIRRFDFVADVRPLYETANVVIVPTLVSAGTNVKVLEALAMERAVVSTPSGVGGLGSATVLVAQSAADFASGIVSLLADEGRRRAMAREGRRTVEAEFDWVAIGEVQRRLWNSL